MKLPHYRPPTLLSAGVALTLAPVVVLLALSLATHQVIAADMALALLVVCLVWVAAEVQAYRRDLDSYDDDYVHHHLAWRDPDTLAVLAALPGTLAATLRFVRAHIERRQNPGAGGGGAAAPVPVPVHRPVTAAPLPPALG